MLVHHFDANDPHGLMRHKPELIIIKVYKVLQLMVEG